MSYRLSSQLKVIYTLVTMWHRWIWGISILTTRYSFTTAVQPTIAYMRLQCWLLPAGKSGPAGRMRARAVIGVLLGFMRSHRVAITHSSLHVQKLLVKRPVRA